MRTSGTPNPRASQTPPRPRFVSLESNKQSNPYLLPNPANPANPHTPEMQGRRVRHGQVLAHRDQETAHRAERLERRKSREEYVTCCISQIPPTVCPYNTDTFLAKRQSARGVREDFAHRTGGRVRDRDRIHGAETGYDSHQDRRGNRGFRARRGRPYPLHNRDVRRVANRENAKYVLRFPNPPPCLPIAQSNYSSTLSHGPKD